MASPHPPAPFSLKRRGKTQTITELAPLLKGRGWGEVAESGRGMRSLLNFELSTNTFEPEK